MQTTNEERLKGWEPYKTLKAILAEKGLARVYICAQECCFKFETAERGFRRYVKEHPNLRLVLLSEEEYTSSGRKVRHKPAIVALIKSPRAFERLWFDMQNTGYMRARDTGCSYILNDGQAFDIRVMDTDHITPDDRFSSFDHVFNRDTRTFVLKVYE